MNVKANKFQYEYARKFIGKQYGLCTVLEITRHQKYNKRTHIHLLLTCKCGRRFEKRADRLKGVTSCGKCLNIIQGKAAFSELYGKYRMRSKEKYGEFLLSKEEFKKITKQPCFYCGKEPNNAYRKKFFKDPYVYNGIDRKDNNKGYLVDNCVPCCKTCNYAKRDLSLEEFYDWVNSLKQNVNKDHRPNKKFPTRSIFFDIDDTIVIWPNKKTDESFENNPLARIFNFMGTDFYLVPHNKHIEELKKLYNEGYEIITWSFGSKEWAKVVIKTLELDKYVDNYLSKPDFYFDDLEIKEYLTSNMRIYYPLEEGKKDDK